MRIQCFAGESATAGIRTALEAADGTVSVVAAGPSAGVSVPIDGVLYDHSTRGREAFGAVRGLLAHSPWLPVVVAVGSDTEVASLPFERAAEARIAPSTIRETPERVLSAFRRAHERLQSNPADGTSRSPPTPADGDDPVAGTRLEVLGAIDTDLLRARTPEEVAQVAGQAVRAGLGDPVVGVWLSDPDGDVLRPCRATAERADFDAPVIERDSGALWRAHDTDDLLRRTPPFDGDPFERAIGVERELLVPLDGYGVLVVGSTDSAAFSADETAFVRALRGTVSGALGRLFRDRRLYASHREVGAKNRRLELLAEVLSHDLTNPLMVAREYAVLAYETDSEEYLTRSDDAIERARSLSNGLFGLALAGRGPVTVEDVPIASLAEDVWAATETGAGTLVVDAGRVVRGDPRLIGRLLEHAFENALEHGPPDVTVRLDDDESGLAIEDDGPGIPPDRRAAVLSDPADPDEPIRAGFRIIRDVATAHGWGLALEEADSGGLRLSITTDRPPSKRDTSTIDD
ncbi:HTR-like protein [Halalkalicoccus jeotgali B3]|uniref:histidine kinase n=3 Tax=Halalkalicoccus jeotgali (strain DSM 18796 / CECT 7217 / JCM 14584 / KCTC 4019 / B3) TaxID=795797 RepID=D8J7X5_HALJB|nr:HAMP domain-containing sensor histidine kinase [Halalkalicoccus jeotgali]ADJ14088.1 HTR-like protein [Halalkalicoccus jeotgali B3]